MRSKDMPVILLAALLSVGTSNAVANQELEDAEQAAIDAEMALLEAEAAMSPWFFVGHSVSGFNYYINVDTIRKYNQYEPLRYENGDLDFANSHTKAWWRVVRTNGDYDQIQTKFYCPKNAAVNVSGIMYSEDGTYKGNLKSSSFVEPIIPDTVHANI
jgi:hypothetical protein